MRSIPPAVFALRYLLLVLPFVGLMTATTIGCGLTPTEDVGRASSSVEDGYGYDDYGY